MNNNQSQKGDADWVEPRASRKRKRSNNNNENPNNVPNNPPVRPPQTIRRFKSSIENEMALRREFLHSEDTEVGDILILEGQNQEDVDYYRIENVEGMKVLVSFLPESSQGGRRTRRTRRTRRSRRTRRAH